MVQSSLVVDGGQGTGKWWIKENDILKERELSDRGKYINCRKWEGDAKMMEGVVREKGEDGRKEEWRRSGKGGVSRRMTLKKKTYI